jgi:hypothetical protein
MEQTVRLKLDTKEFERGISGATKAIGALVTGAIATSIVKTTARFEDLNTTLGSVFGSANKGTQAFAAIQKIATKTQFGVEDLSKTFVKLASSGIQPTEKLIKTFTDAAAVTTDQVGTLEAITDLFSRTVSGGLGLEELNRLADRGVPAFSILEEKLGLTRLQISEFGKTAEGARKITEALGQGIEERFGGATEARLKNLSTSMSNFSIAIKNSQNAIGSGFAPVFTGMLNQITELITNNQHLAESFGQVLGAALNGVQFLANLVAENFKLIASVATGLTVTLGARGLAGAVALLRKNFIGLTKAMMRNPFGLLAVAAASLISYLAFDNGLGKTFAQLKAVVDVLGRAFAQFANFLKDKVSKVINKLKEIFLSFVQTALDGYNVLADFLPLLERFDGDASDLTGTVIKFGKDGLEYVTEKAGALKDALVDAVPKEVVTIFEDSAAAAEKAGDAYLKAQKKLEQSRQDKGLGIPTIPGMSAGGVTIPKIGDDLQKRFTSLEESFLSEKELEVNAYNDKLKTLNDFYANKLEDDSKYAKLREQLESRHQKNLARISKSEVDKQVDIFKSGQFQNLNLAEMTEKQKVEFTKQAGMSVLTELGKQNKAAFQAAKALNIANAIMNTAAGATKALSQGGVFGPLLAGLVIAAGAIQIATIQSQQYQGRKTGGLVQKGTPYMVGEAGAEMFVPNQTGTIIPNRNMGGGQTVNVNFSINTVDAAGVDELLVSRRGTITNIIRDAAQQRGQRSPV